MRHKGIKYCSYNSGQQRKEKDWVDMRIMTLGKKIIMKEIPSNFSNPSWNTFSRTCNGQQVQRKTARHNNIVAVSHYRITGVNKGDSDYSEKIVTL